MYVRLILNFLILSKYIFVLINLICFNCNGFVIGDCDYFIILLNIMSWNWLMLIVIILGYELNFGDWYIINFYY